MMNKKLMNKQFPQTAILLERMKAERNRGNDLTISSTLLALVLSEWEE